MTLWTSVQSRIESRMQVGIKDLVTRTIKLANDAATVPPPPLPPLTGPARSLPR